MLPAELPNVVLSPHRYDPSASMQAHLGTGVTALSGLGHGSGNHAPTPAGFVDFIDHPTQLFEPNTSYWQAAWSATLATAPGYMTGVVNAELKRNSNPNSNVSHQDSGIVMLDYEPAYRPNWRFQTNARPDKRWEALMSIGGSDNLYSAKGAFYTEDFELLLVTTDNAYRNGLSIISAAAIAADRRRQPRAPPKRPAAPAAPVAGPGVHSRMRRTAPSGR
jgi:hypothetical protein